MWPRTEGVITESAIHVMTGPSSRRKHRSHIAYTYEVHGETFRSTQVAYDTDGGPEERAKYQIGQTVTVYYKPSQPGEAVLEPGRRGHGFMLCFLGLASLGACALATLIVSFYWHDLGE